MKFVRASEKKKWKTIYSNSYQFIFEQVNVPNEFTCLTCVCFYIWENHFECEKKVAKQKLKIIKEKKTGTNKQDENKSSKWSIKHREKLELTHTLHLKQTKFVASKMFHMIQLKNALRWQ